MAENSLKQIGAFFSTEDKPVKTAELMEFWKSLSDGDKAYYKSADLS